MIIVTAGIIQYNRKILIAKRLRSKQQGLLWEFPGGKLESGETLEQCLQREIFEEFHLPIQTTSYFMRSDYNYDFGSVRLEVFWAQASTSDINFMDSHEEYRWINLTDLTDYDFAPADRPIVQALLTSSSPLAE